VGDRLGEMGVRGRWAAWLIPVLAQRGREKGVPWLTRRARATREEESELAAWFPPLLAERAHLGRVLVRCAQSSETMPHSQEREWREGEEGPRHGNSTRPRGEAPVLAGAGWVGCDGRSGRAGEKAARNCESATSPLVKKCGRGQTADGPVPARNGAYTQKVLATGKGERCRAGVGG